MNPIPDLPGLPRDAEGPVFGAPWQAQAFAMAVALHARGLFTWREWAQALAQVIRAAPAQDGEDAGEAYWRQWLLALETLVGAKGASSADELQRYQQAWDHAAERTPHGRAIELRPEDFPPAQQP
ncbi:nitrile hydratase accessory protein [Ramlibacter ginsenosidimutans]|uniref:Nitrile hydratase accessory protein n=1 Tax=Ramlibacter ginsenosidimutans TaxID=502333 RepID=A0A934WLC9_9BURK|nr:nitrile hydratase accessory protein [Ramlibacter ginsenosidimutans]MBK6004967.1 nitrile hydratase accessory protein [Ramlibacter ginsenosidimutans]